MLRAIFPGKSTAMAILYQSVSLEKTYIEKKLHRQKYIYMQVTTINKKKAMNLKESKEGYMGGFGGRKQRMM